MWLHECKHFFDLCLFIGDFFDLEVPSGLKFAGRGEVTPLLPHPLRAVRASVSQELLSFGGTRSPPDIVPPRLGYVMSRTRLRATGNIHCTMSEMTGVKMIRDDYCPIGSLVIANCRIRLGQDDIIVYSNI